MQADQIRVTADKKHHEASPDQPEPAVGERLDPLGVALRAAYREAVEEPVPSEILDLLAKLR